MATATRYPVAARSLRGSGNQLSFSAVRPSARAAGVQAVAMTRSPFTGKTPTLVSSEDIISDSFTSSTTLTTTPPTSTTTSATAATSPLSSSSPSSTATTKNGKTKKNKKPATSPTSITATAATATATAAAAPAASDDSNRAPTVEELILRHGEEQRIVQSSNVAAIREARKRADQMLATSEQTLNADRRACEGRHAAERAEMERRHQTELAALTAREEAARLQAASLVSSAESEAIARVAALSAAHQKLLQEAGAISRRAATQTASALAATSTRPIAA